jgi:hypothetical protein
MTASSVGVMSRIASLAFEPKRAARLLRGGRKRRQFLHVARVVLDEHCRLGIRRDLLEALERRDRLRAIIVEPRHAVGIEILAEVRGIAGDDHGAHLRQLDQEPVMTRRVAGPSPNTSLSVTIGSTLFSPLVQPSNGL